MYSLHVCIYIYIHTYIHVHIYIHICIERDICICVHDSIYISLSLSFPDRLLWPGNPSVVACMPSPPRASGSCAGEQTTTISLYVYIYICIVYIYI